MINSLFKSWKQLQFRSNHLSDWYQYYFNASDKEFVLCCSVIWLTLKAIFFSLIFSSQFFSQLQLTMTLTLMLTLTLTLSLKLHLTFHATIFPIRFIRFKGQSWGVLQDNTDLSRRLAFSRRYFQVFKLQYYASMLCCNRLAMLYFDR